MDTMLNSIAAIVHLPRFVFKCLSQKTLNDVFFLASIRGEIKLVKKLLDFGVDLDRNNHFKATPLLAAALSGRVDVIKLLLELGPDVEAESKLGNLNLRAIHAASFHVKIDSIKTLLQYGKADIKAMCSEGSVLHFSPLTDVPKRVVKEYQKMLEFLIDSGADVEAVNAKGWRPIHVLAQEGCVSQLSYMYSRLHYSSIYSRR